jgi:DNA-binding HxlR family transcriptional regulator
MAVLDLLGRRWALRIVWELREGPLGFRALQSRCDGMSPSVLSQRLAELAEAGIVGQAPTQDYGLTESGRDLLKALSPLASWANRWASGPGPSIQNPK